MAVLVTTGGADYFARLFLGIEQRRNLLVLLFVNYRTPTVNDTYYNYTECAWPGYSPVLLLTAQWQGSAVNGVASYEYPLITFNFDAASGQPPETVYGYLVVSDDYQLLYLEAFAAPFPIPPEGGQIPLIMTWVDEQCTD